MKTKNQDNCKGCAALFKGGDTVCIPPSCVFGHSVYASFEGTFNKWVNHQPCKGVRCEKPTTLKALNKLKRKLETKDG